MIDARLQTLWNEIGWSADFKGVESHARVECLEDGYWLIWSDAEGNDLDIEPLGDDEETATLNLIEKALTWRADELVGKTFWQGKYRLRLPGGKIFYDQIKRSRQFIYVKHAGMKQWRCISAHTPIRLTPIGEAW
jgi:hypothetical protein